MPVLDQHIGPATPMGGTLVADGAVFRTWAPTARDVYLVTDPAILAAPPPGWTPDARDRLRPLGDGTWGGFAPGLADDAPYLLWIRGTGSEGWKRDPHAR